MPDHVGQNMVIIIGFLHMGVSFLFAPTNGNTRKIHCKILSNGWIGILINVHISDYHLCTKFYPMGEKSFYQYSHFRLTTCASNFTQWVNKYLYQCSHFRLTTCAPNFTQWVNRHLYQCSHFRLPTCAPNFIIVWSTYFPPDGSTLNCASIDPFISSWYQVS